MFDLCGFGFLALAGVVTDVGPMKTVARFGKSEDAHLCRMHLGSAGIEAIVQDENMAQLEQPRSNAAGGVSVEVNDEDFDAAMEVLATDKGVPPESDASH